ncbi:MAG: hypothetical protein ACR2HN_02220 [Tepidiformaceae bacterium]
MSRDDQAWRSDPLLEEAELHRQARARLIRSAVIWTPPAAAAVGALVFFIVDRITGPNYGATWFLVGVLTFLGSLFAFQASQAWRDLAGEPEEMTGLVTRRWSRTDSLVVRSHYIRVANKIFTIQRDLHGDVMAGDNVSLKFYPHSAIVISVKRVDPSLATLGTLPARER